ncbi:MAG: hypothetical protein KF833_18240 [Verrucomicrobiae bacterium]|nr:hypothetical protein [Verrucomicrobiae bacterium]
MGTKRISDWCWSRVWSRAFPGWVAGVLAAAAAGLSHGAAHGAGLPPGVSPCFTSSIPSGYGTFVWVRGGLYQQSGDTAPVPAASGAGFASLELLSPSAFAVSNVVVSGPGGFQAPLTARPGGMSEWNATYESEPAVEEALRAGSWITRFQVIFPGADPFIGFFPFLIASNTPPVPQVANLAAAQAIPAGGAFALNWVPWAGSGAADRVAVALTDGAGNTVWSAATDCGGETPIVPGATSVEIPAGRLAAGTTYTGHLTFGGSVLAAQDESSLLVERGFQTRTTRFTVRTTGSGGGPPASLGGVRVVDGSLVLTLTGGPGTSYLVQSSPDFTAWTDETTVVVPAGGSVEVTLPLAADGGPRFLRAIALGGGDPSGGEAAQLVLAATGAGELALTLTGTPGATYTIESSSNYVAWATVREVTVPAGQSNVVVAVSVVAGRPLEVFRAVSAAGPPPPPPPTGEQPTLVLARDAGGGFRLTATGGDANRTYGIQRTDATFGTWTDVAETLTTDASGTGSVLLPAAGELREGFFRTIGR